jgi:hypothetical protein
MTSDNAAPNNVSSNNKTDYSKFSLWAFCRRFDILDEKTGALYLRRWRLVQTPWFGIYLHKIAMPDKDRDLHDHPWSFVSVVLRGGYDEKLKNRYGFAGCDGIHKRGWLSIAFRRATDAHRILSLSRTPTWTLVFVGVRRRSWGFYTDKGYVDWRSYLGVEQ